jgi:Undecaprenyl-phosphate glucose phosphotransferase
MLRFLKYAGLQLRLILSVIPIIVLIPLYVAAGENATLTLPNVPFAVLLLFTVAVWQLLIERHELAHVEQLFAFSAGLRKTLAATVSLTIAHIMLLFFMQATIGAGRSFVLAYGLLVGILALITRLLFRAILSKRRIPIRVLVIGADEFASRAAESLSTGTVIPCEIVGFVRLPGQRPQCDGQILELHEVARKNVLDGVDEITIAAPPSMFAELPNIMRDLERACVPIRAILDFGEGNIVRDHIFQVNGLHLLDLHRNPTESLSYILAKRTFDIVFSALVLILVSPILALIAILVKLSSQGPVFFVQDRVGLNGKVFRMYKFRTMCVNSDGDTVWTTKADQRCTAIGGILRKTSLDELPQFYNVLRGDMSVVGPRPERPHFVSQFLNDVERYNIRHSLKVGMTGWAQVNGWRGDTAIDKRVEYDLYYLRNWSFGFDLQIVALTLVRGLVNKNAY